LIRCERWSFLFLLMLISGCAHIAPFSPPYMPFSEKEITNLISNLKEQQESVSSFQGIGRLRYKVGDRESELSLFAVGCRPFKIRLEITHPWGKPIFHIVVDERKISALSIVDNKFFQGPLTSLNMKRFIKFDLELDSAWKIFSGRIPILPYDRADSVKAHEITLYNKRNEVVEIISFFPQNLLPRTVSFPKKGLSIMLSEFKEGDSGMYPSGIKIVDRDEDQLLDIRYTSLEFNKLIPEEIFQLNPPPDFKIIQLGYNGN